MARTVASIAMCTLVVGMSVLMLDAAGQPRALRASHFVATNSEPKKSTVVDSMIFDIPAQPLQKALDIFGALTGFSGLYGTASMSGRVSTPVSGYYKPDVALNLMLEGTGLAVYFTAIDAFILEPAPSHLAPARESGYEGLLQAQVRDVFCRDPLISRGDYRIALRFHLDASGRVLRPLLLDTTGDIQRDHAILSALRRVDVGRGPADISKPFFMLILPKTLVSAHDCVVH